MYLTEDYAYVDNETGEPVADTELDPDTEDDEEAEAAEGRRHYSTVTEKTVIAPEWYCQDYAAAGLALAPSLHSVASRRGAPTVVGDDAEAKPVATAANRAAARVYFQQHRAHMRRQNDSQTAEWELVGWLVALKTPWSCLTRSVHLSHDHPASPIAPPAVEHVPT